MAAPFLNQSALVDAVLEVCEEGQSRKQVKDILESLAYVGQEQIGKGNRFRVPGLGTIEIRFRSAIKKGKEVRNPATGATFKHPGKPASTKIGFRPMKPLTEALPTVQKAKQAQKRSKV